MADLPTGTVTLLFTDVESSTQILQLLGPRYGDVLAEYRALLRAIFQTSGGREVDTQGDSFFVAFPRALDAVAATVAIQRALATPGAHPDWPVGAPMATRMGVHSGEPQRQSESYVGLDVHRVARIAAAGHGGQVLLSASTRALIARDLPEGITIRDLGEHHLKDFPHPEWIYQLVVAGLPADFPPLNGLVARSNTLPVQPTPFIGRAEDVGAVCDRLLDPGTRLMTVTGPGGVGKTRLVIAAATAVAPHFPHGTVFVGLQPLTRSDLLVPAIMQAVSLTFYGEGEPREQLLDYLRDKTLLLILDNFDHLLDGAVLVTTILEYAPAVKVLATSREPLNLREEWLYPLTGMSTPPSVYSTSLETYEAIQLFLYHARRVQPHYDLAREQEAVVRICQLAAGLPLALELATSWLKGLTTTQIVQAMQRNLDFLSTTTRNVEERHRSMRAVFDQSWTLLSEDERLIFARLSIFRGGFDGAAADQVAEASFTCLAALVEKSLVHREHADHFGIHELLSQYGMEKLAAYEDIETTYARHSRYFAQVMLQHETALKGAEQSETMGAIERDFENIRLAWDWSATHQQVTQLNMMLHGLYLFGFLGSRHNETITIFQQTLDRPLADAPLRGRLLARRWGYLHWWYQTDYQEALTQIEQALTIMRAQHNQFEIAFCHLMAAYAMISLQRNAEALPHLEASRALFDTLDEPYYVCWVLHRLGYVCYTLKEHDKAVSYTHESLRLARVTHNRVALVSCLHNLGLRSILSGDYVTGREYCAEALQFAIKAGHQDQIALVSSLLALCALLRGDYTGCQEYAERAQTIAEARNRLVFQPYSLSLLILLACLREDYAEGTRLKEVGKDLNTYIVGSLLFSWALAALACGVGNAALARISLQNMLQFSDPGKDTATIVWMVPAVTYTLAETDPEHAVELLAWVFTYPDTALDWARHWPLFDRLQEQLQGAMDRDSYQMRWDRGKALSFDAIASYLRQEFPTASDSIAVGAHEVLLTAREREVLRLMATGMTNPQIAAQLVIGAGTVKTHTLNIYRKLEVANRTQAIVRAQEWELLRS